MVILDRNLNLNLKMKHLIFLNLTIMLNFGKFIDGSHEYLVLGNQNCCHIIYRQHSLLELNMVLHIIPINKHVTQNQYRETYSVPLRIPIVSYLTSLFIQNYLIHKLDFYRLNYINFNTFCYRNNFITQFEQLNVCLGLFFI